MKEKPILFSTETIRAILENRKTQTRRIIKIQPDFPVRYDGDNNPEDGTATGWHWWERLDDDGEPTEDYRSLGKCRFGNIGDRLWVKETWRIDDFDENETIYKADISDEILRDVKGIAKWKSSLFMPRSRSRITLEITDIRVEQIQDISTNDILAEGLLGQSRNFHLESIQDFHDDYQELFKQLWKRINGTDSWGKNPWVWAITFKKGSLGE